MVILKRTLHAMAEYPRAILMLILGAQAILALLLYSINSIVELLYPFAWIIFALVAYIVVVPRVARSSIPLVVLVGAFLLATATLGQLFARDLYSYGGVGAQLILDTGTSLRTARLISLSSLAMLAGALASSTTTSRGSWNLDARPWRASVSVVRADAGGGTAIACTIPLVLFLSSAGLSTLISRSDYLVGEPGSLASVASPLMVVAVVLCGSLICSNEKHLSSYAALLIVAYGLVFFSLGTRRFALVPVLICLGLYLTRPTIKSFISALLSVVMSYLLLPIPIYLRGLSEHGLTSYASNLSMAYSDTGVWLDALNNIVTSFPLIGTTAYEAPTIGVGTILTEVNPLPGEIAGWYDVSDSLRINRFTPFSGVGELGNAGVVTVLVFWFIVGFLLVYLDSRVGLLLAEGRLAYSIVLVGLVALFALTCVQYNLRTGTRILYYALAFDLGVRLYTWLFRPRLQLTPDAYELNLRPMSATITTEGARLK